MTTPFGVPEGFDMNALGAALQQLGTFLQQGGGTGPVRWDLVRSVATGALPPGSDAADPAPWVDDTMRLANVWLDEATTFPATTAAAQVWTRRDWLEKTLPAWEPIAEPIAQHMQQMASVLPGDTADIGELLPAQMRDMFPEGQLPAEFERMLAPMMGMLQQLGAVAFSMQLGQALATLAGEVLSAGDIGIPLSPDDAPAFLPSNMDAFADELGIPVDEIRLYIALREGAHQRLFAHVPWLKPRLIGAIEEYAKGLRVDTSRIQESLGDIDVSNPEALQSLMASGLLEPPDTPEQRAALARMSTLLAMVEGWVDDVVAVAMGDRLGSAQALQETMRRRRAVGGPAERAFGTLVGMELRPTALREAATICQGVRAMRGVAARDHMWSHPDHMPDAADLAEPMDFIARSDDDTE